MDPWKTLEPVKLYSSATSVLSRSKTVRNAAPTARFIGRLPLDIYELILVYLAVPDIPSFARVCKHLGTSVRDGGHWEWRWKRLCGIERAGEEEVGAVYNGVLDEVETTAGKVQSSTAANTSNLSNRAVESKGEGNGTASNSGPAMLQVDEEDDFGDFSMATLSVNPPPRAANGSTFEECKFSPITPTKPAPSAFTLLSPVTSKSTLPTPTVKANPCRQKYIRAHTLLKSLLPALHSAPHQILATLFPASSPTLTHSPVKQSLLLHLLQRFLSPSTQPLRNGHWQSLRNALRGAVDRFEAQMLGAFEGAEGRGDEKAMSEAAVASWRVWERKATASMREGWEMGKVWIEKQEIFYESGRWDPLANFSSNGLLAFDSMDAFMSHIISSIKHQGTVAVRVFPAESGVLGFYGERLASEVIGEYAVPLLTRARELGNEVFLKATAACFIQSFRIVDVLCEVGGSTTTSNGVATSPSIKVEPAITRTEGEDVVYKMFEQHMDEYLDEEVEWVKISFERVVKEWDRKHSAHLANQKDGSPQATRFLASSNPQLVKRNVLASFANVLLMPVTIVPKTVGAIVGAGGSALVGVGEGVGRGVEWLDPRRWGGQATGAEHGRARDLGYQKELEGRGEAIFDEDEDEDEDEKEDTEDPRFLSSTTTAASASSSTLQIPGSTNPTSRSPSPNPSVTALDLLLSLDVALELIHAFRECLKRLETFDGYPGHYGHKVRETIEECFILLLGSLGEGHVQKGFNAATEQMRSYKPTESDSATNSVAPLVQFFELVHIGDTIQSMIQVFFDKEMVRYVDPTDFLSGVMREKKRFENGLDESVAGGLNAGTEVLMSQVEHIIWTETGPREYYPVEGSTMELGPTKACTDAIACLEMHCKLLKGSTSKEVLEVFYQEVGIRLQAILQKHIKRQIISLDGGFQVIADLNAYHAFVTSLRVPTITADFANLKMLGHVYIVSDAKDLAQIVRDVTRYGGAYRPEDIYEFIQRRSDWKKIEKTVDKTMYNLSFKEDCVVM